LRRTEAEGGGRRHDRSRKTCNQLTGSEGRAGFPSRRSRSTGSRASRTALAKTSCVEGGTHPKIFGKEDNDAITVGRQSLLHPKKQDVVQYLSSQDERDVIALDSETGSISAV